MSQPEYVPPRRRCGHCGRVAEIARRGRNGEGDVCVNCYRTHAQPRRRCGRCGRLDAVGRRARDGTPDICVNCYKPPQHTCSACGRKRPCYYIAEDRPTCFGCIPRSMTTCVHCGQDRPAAAHWPEGPVCGPCYEAALRRRGRCADCGAVRRLVSPPGPSATRCCDCAGLPARSTCSECGHEDKLFERGRCAPCALARQVALLLAGPDGAVVPALAGVRDAIVGSSSPYKALNWLRGGAGAPILGDIAAGRMALSHEALDRHRRPRAADYVRHMLVAHGALAERDEDVARFERWIDVVVAGIARPDDARLVRAFATWHTLRGLRRRVERAGSKRRTATRSARTQIRGAVAFLDWLDQGQLALAECTQGDVEQWLTGPPSRRDARSFLAWVCQHGLCVKLTIDNPVRHDGDALDSELRWDIARRLLNDNTVALVDRVAGSLVLLYAQPLSRISVMTTDQVIVSPKGVGIRFAREPVEIPEPLGGLVTELAATGRRDHVGIGAPTTTPWLFPGHLPGRPMTPSRIGDRLTPLGIDARAARRAALLQLAAEIPAPVLAESLGLTASTATDWVKAAGGDWASYAGFKVRSAIREGTAKPSPDAT